MKKYLIYLLLLIAPSVYGVQSGNLSNNSEKCANNDESCKNTSVDLKDDRMQQDNPSNSTCSKFGEYCQLHSQCCSKNCMTFRLKCGPSLRDDLPESTTKFSIRLAQGNASDNINSSDESDSSEESFTTPSVCQVVGQKCMTHSDCCSKNCFSFNYQCVNAMPTFLQNQLVLNTRFAESTNQCQAIGERCDAHDQCCSKNCLTFKRQCIYQAGIVIPPGSIVEAPIMQADDSFITRFSEPTNQCQAIGERCDAHEQCCSKNCLKFKRQCVYQAGISIPAGSVMPVREETVNSRFGEPTCQSVGQRCDAHEDCCSRNCLKFKRQCISPAGINNSPFENPPKKIVSVVTRFEDNTQQCQVVGEHCSSHDQCCSRNCLFFLQQCVRQAGLLPPMQLMPTFMPNVPVRVDPVANRFGESTSDCQAIGRPCGSHEECCSKNCLIFKHQCVYPAVLGPPTNSVAPLPVNPPSNSIATIPNTDDLDNRFGGEDTTNSNVCRQNGQECTGHTQCCSGNCLNFNRQCVSTQHPVPARDPLYYVMGPPLPPRQGSVPNGFASNQQSRINCQTNGKSCNHGNDCCSLNCDKNSNVCSTRVNQNVNQGNSSNANKDTGNNIVKCLSTGLQCSRNEECCSVQCDGLLNKCAT